MTSLVVPEPVVVCRWRSQLLLSYAVRLSGHATSTKRVVFDISQGDDNFQYDVLWALINTR